ncbi:MAG: hypothetical protein ACI82F_001985 [Planctomycetota bacterium]|jgi:hypothetical protein
MMGHVMNLFTQFVHEKGGEEARLGLYTHIGVSPREYHFEELYPEEEFTALVVAALENLSLSVPELEEAFADFFMRASPTIFPAVFEIATGARDLLSRIPHLHRSIPSAVSRDSFVDKLIVKEERTHSLLLKYDSPHRLCGFLQHVCQLTLEHYGETGRIEEHECAREGEAACLIEVHFDEDIRDD